MTWGVQGVQNFDALLDRGTEPPVKRGGGSVRRAKTERNWVAYPKKKEGDCTKSKTEHWNIKKGGGYFLEEREVWGVIRLICLRLTP